VDRLAFRDKDPCDGARHPVGIDVDVFSAGLCAFHDALGVDAPGVRIGRGTEQWRLCRLYDGEEIRSNPAGKNADQGKYR
jgi:hypothetical protein